MKKLKLIILVIVLISSLFILSGCTSSIAETEKQFILISEESTFDIYYHKKTKVMYAVSDYNYNKGNLTVLVDAEGKPLLYEGD